MQVSNRTTLIIILIFLTVLKNLLLILTQKKFVEIKFQVIQDLLSDTYQDFFKARWHFFISSRQGVLGNSLMKEISMVGTGLTYISRMVTDLFKALFYFIIALTVSAKASLLIMGLAILLAKPFLTLGRRMLKWGKETTRTGNIIYQEVLETLSAAKLIIGFGQQSKSINSMKKFVNDHLDANFKAAVLGNSTTLIHEPIGFAIIMLAIYLGVNVFKISIAELFILLYCFRAALLLLAQSVNLRNKATNLLPSFNQVMDLKSLARKEIQPSGTRKFSDYKNEIIFKNVCFGYPEHETILHNINIKITKGGMIAFVGGSGAGKTTLIDLLMGFYEPVKGDILVDGIPLKEIDILSWRHHLGYVPQEDFLFNMSIRDNLLWSKDDAAEQEITAACKLANADEFIRKLKDGYNTVVGDRGARLSGGQRQRIALARAIIRQPYLLILDEATSELDSHSELLIQQAIEKIASKTTVVVIAHRLSTIVKADFIYVLENGYIVEQGTYKELIDLNGKFHKLIQSQKY